MSDIKNPDYLSRLPPELLDDIFELAAGSSEIVKAPLSRALQPHIERAFYRELRLTSSYRFGRLGATANRDVLLFVQSLAVEQYFDIDDNYEQWEPERAIEWESGGADYDELEPPLRLLPNLEDLSIVGCTRLCLLVLSSPIAASSLPSLKSLKLESTFDGIEDPFHPSHYANLQCYRNLERLHLSVRRWVDTIESSPTPMPSPFISLSSLKYLHLCGPISASQHVSSLLECLPNLTDISLEDGTSSVRILHLLNSLPSPRLLTSISAASFGHASNTERPAPSISFASFSGLQSLKLAGSVNLEGHDFYKDLRHLPLRHLKLGYGTRPSVSGLMSLLKGTSSQVHLETVILDNHHAYLEYDIASLNYAVNLQMLNYGIYIPEKDGEDKASIELTLQGPTWTKHLSKQGLSDLFRAGEEMGVSIHGRTLDALRLEEKLESGEVERERVIAREERAKDKARRESVEGHA